METVDEWDAFVSEKPFRTPPLTRLAAVELYAGLLELDGDLVDAILRELRGRNLACWCLAL